MPKSFDSLFEELHGLPSGSGPLECCKPRLSLEEAQQKLDKLMSIIAGISTFRGQALKNRVLAAHPPNRPGDEKIASSPLAAAAIVELYTDIARHSPVFAPIVLGSSLETSEEVLELMTDVRSVVEKEQRCSLLWQHNVFKGFVKLSRDRSDVAQSLVQKLTQSRDARAQLSRRIEMLLIHARAAQKSGQAFCLQSIEDVWSVVLAQQAAKHELPIECLSEIKSLGAIGLVEAFAAKQPDGRIDAVSFAAADGAALMNNVVMRSRRSETSMLLSFMYDVARLGDSTHATSDDQPSVISTLHKLLSCPNVLPLLFRFFKHGIDEYGFPLTSLFRSATGYAHHSAAPQVPIREALALCNVEFREDAITVLEDAVSCSWSVKLRGQDVVPDAFSSPMWYRKVMPEIRAAIVATGLYVAAAPAPANTADSANLPYIPQSPAYNPQPPAYNPQSPAYNPAAPLHPDPPSHSQLPTADAATAHLTGAADANENQRPSTPAAIAEAIERALVTLSRHSWFVRETLNSMHPFTRIKGIAIRLLVLGEHLASAAQSAGQADFGGAEAIKARFRSHWRSIFRLEGPPQECPQGYNCCDFDASCMSCGMPRKYCPSLFRLRVEIREFMARNRNDGAIEEVAEVDVDAASAVASEFQGAYQYPEAPPDVQNAARAMVAAGLVKAKRLSWGFTGPGRPVCFICSGDNNVTLSMRPIT